MGPSLCGFNDHWNLAYNSDNAYGGFVSGVERVSSFTGVADIIIWLGAGGYYAIICRLGYKKYGHLFQACYRILVCYNPFGHGSSPFRGPSDPAMAAASRGRIRDLQLLSELET